MKKCHVVWLLLIAMLAPNMRAQTDVKSFEKALKGKPLYLRSNSADDVVTYTWDKNALKLGKVDVYALTAFLVKWAEAKNNHIILFGTSVDPIHFQYGGTKFSNIPFYFFHPIKIDVDLQDAASSVVLPQLQAMLFYPDDKSAILNLPIELECRIPYNRDHPEPFCKGWAISLNGQWKMIGLGDAQFSPPVPLFDTSGMHKGGPPKPTLLFIVTITDKGDVGDIWVQAASDHDEIMQSKEMLRKLKFKPATYAGEPVGTTIRLWTRVDDFIRGGAIPDAMGSLPVPSLFDMHVVYPY